MSQSVHLGDVPACDLRLAPASALLCQCFVDHPDFLFFSFISAIVIILYLYLIYLLLFILSAPRSFAELPSCLPSSSSQLPVPVLLFTFVPWRGVAHTVAFVGTPWGRSLRFPLGPWPPCIYTPVSLAERPGISSAPSAPNGVPGRPFGWHPSVSVAIEVPNLLLHYGCVCTYVSKSSRVWGSLPTLSTCC